MPLLKKILLRDQMYVYIWHATESEEDLLYQLQLTQYCKWRLSQMKISQHRRNFLATRQVLCLHGLSLEDLHYTTTGKPMLSNGKGYISISHSFDYVVVTFCDAPIGVDIESCREKLFLTAKRYTDFTDNQLHSCNAGVLLKLCKIWSAKEAMYKVHARKGLNLKTQILLNDVLLTETTAIGKIVADNHTVYYKVEYLHEIENYVIAVVFPL